jgi:hypothetical protein
MLQAMVDYSLVPGDEEASGEESDDDVRARRTRPHLELSSGAVEAFSVSTGKAGSVALAKEVQRIQLELGAQSVIMYYMHLCSVLIPFLIR